MRRAPGGYLCFCVAAEAIEMEVKHVLQAEWNEPMRRQNFIDGMGRASRCVPVHAAAGGAIATMGNSP
jgi:hypothetical protein